MCPKIPSASNADWQREFDQRVASGRYRTDTHWRMGRRVADDTGKLFTRSGAPCCGCGKSETAADDNDNRNRGPRYRQGGQGRMVSARNPHGSVRGFGSQVGGGGCLSMVMILGALGALIAKARR